MIPEEYLVWHFHSKALSWMFIELIGELIDQAGTLNFFPDYVSIHVRWWLYDLPAFDRFAKEFAWLS